MNKTLKILLGLATLWPFAYLFLFFVFIFSTAFFMPKSGEESGPPFLFLAFMAVHIFTMLWIMALTVFYMVNVFKNDRVEKDKKVLWAVVLFMGSMIAMPIYWYLYIWKEAPVNNVPVSSALRSASAAGWVTEANATGEHQYVPPAQPPNWRE
jgi:hypothetical protein